MSRKILNQKEAFLANVQPEPNSGCWLWDAAWKARGYGYCNRKSIGLGTAAHRISYSLFVGDIPEDMHVLHKCDITCCVNPDHLFLGSHDDNMKDMARKGRSKKPRHRKIPLDVAAIIKKDNRPSREVAKDYGIGKSQVLRIRKWNLDTGDFIWYNCVLNE